MPWPTSPTIGDVYQPEPPDGTSYIYRGNGRWDVLIQPSAASLAGYYIKSQVEALLAAEDAALASIAAAKPNPVENAYQRPPCSVVEA